MKAEITKISRGDWRVRIVQGVQSFELSYRGNRDECAWVKRMFEKALKFHNKGRGCCPGCENPNCVT